MAPKPAVDRDCAGLGATSFVVSDLIAGDRRRLAEDPWHRGRMSGAFRGRMPDAVAPPAPPRAAVDERVDVGSGQAPAPGRRRSRGAERDRADLVARGTRDLATAMRSPAALPVPAAARTDAVKRVSS
jgi:hypothetical protein